jgi:hypothetical protein
MYMAKMFVYWGKKDAKYELWNVSVLCVGVSACCKKRNKEGRGEFVFEKEVCACVYKNIDVCVCCMDRECLQRKKWVYMSVC